MLIRPVIYSKLVKYLCVCGPVKQNKSPSANMTNASTNSLEPLMWLSQRPVKTTGARRPSHDSAGLQRIFLLGGQAQSVRQTIVMVSVRVRDCLVIVGDQGSNCSSKMNSIDKIPWPPEAQNRPNLTPKLNPIIFKLGAVKGTWVKINLSKFDWTADWTDVSWPHLQSWKPLDMCRSSCWANVPWKPRTCNKMVAGRPYQCPIR